MALLTTDNTAVITSLGASKLDAVTTSKVTITHFGMIANSQAQGGVALSSATTATLIGGYTAVSSLTVLPIDDDNVIVRCELDRFLDAGTFGGVALYAGSTLLAIYYWPTQWSKGYGGLADGKYFEVILSRQGIVNQLVTANGSLPYVRVASDLPAARLVDQQTVWLILGRQGALSALGTQATIAVIYNGAWTQVAVSGLLSQAGVADVYGTPTYDRNYMDRLTNSNLTLDYLIKGLQAGFWFSNGSGSTTAIDPASYGATTSRAGFMTPAQVVALGNKADLLSPIFSGAPQAPTVDINNSSNQIATTSFVHQAISSALTLVAGIGTLASQDYDAVSITGGTITGTAITVSDPVAPTDAANKRYIDNMMAGLDIKPSVSAASTGDVNISSAPSSLDGVAGVAGARWLLKDQTNAAQNGIYIFSATGSALTRASDMDSWSEFPGALTLVEQGSVNANTGYVCTVASGGTLGTTPVTWSQFFGTGIFQPASALLTAIAALSMTTDKFIYGTGSGTVALATITSAGRSLVAAADAAAGRSVLGLGALATKAAAAESDLSLSDVTTANVSTSMHGFAPKLPNDSSKYLNGVGTWSVPSGGGVTGPSGGVSDGDAVVFSGTTGGIIAGAGAGPITQGLHIIGNWPARSLRPAATSGCAALSLIESTTNKVNDEYLAFADGATSYAGFSFRAPKKLNTGTTLTAEIEWMEAPSASAHVCRWQIEMQAQADGATIDSSWGTAVTVDATGASGQRKFATISGITPGGTWTAGAKILVRVARLGAHANDTLNVDARLIGVSLFATVNAKNDA